MDVAGASNKTSTLSDTGAVTLLDDLEMSKQSVALTHSGSTGGGLSITSTNGYVEISSTASYVDVESVEVHGCADGRERSPTDIGDAEQRCLGLGMWRARWM